VDVLWDLSLTLVVVLLSLSKLAPGVEQLSCILSLMPGVIGPAGGAWIGALGSCPWLIPD